MSVDGSISASALFHDKDGTTTMKVVSLESVESPSTGRVAIVTGTCDSSGVTIDLADAGYMSADGTTVGWNAALQSIEKIAFAAAPEANLTGNAHLKELRVGSKDGSVCVTGVPHGTVFSSGTFTYSLTVLPKSGQTATYTIVVYGD